MKEYLISWRIQKDRVWWSQVKAFVHDRSHKNSRVLSFGIDQYIFIDENGHVNKIVLR